MSGLVKPLAGVLEWVDGAKIRVVTLDPEPMLVAKDVALALEYRDADKMLRLLDEETKSTHIVGTPGGPQQMATITRLGLIMATLNSRNPQVKEFRVWALKQIDNIMQNQPVEAPSGAVVQRPVAPLAPTSDSLEVLQTRMRLNKLPPGYFSVFKEVFELAADLVVAGLVMSQHTILDISVGVTWAAEWKRLDGDNQLGERTQFMHYYPEKWAQAGAVQGTLAWIYPDAALPAFRKWMHEVYIPEKLPSYLQRKATKRELTQKTVNQIIVAVVPQQLKGRK